jgi:hypothetical protein
MLYCALKAKQGVVVKNCTMWALHINIASPFGDNEKMGVAIFALSLIFFNGYHRFVNFMVICKFMLFII